MTERGKKEREGKGGKRETRVKEKQNVKNKTKHGNGEVGREEKGKETKSYILISSLPLLWFYLLPPHLINLIH